ncbi:palmitoyltransferase ZDHHC6 isoform X2 [Nematostella vectensis]|uniref:palmitoyltransferase ZDHHC6 isoform X2 n=1 Tax=Nematostella vectensis TaxID=45351 RepID=UPI002076F204|nr:palmitoyltransferase ZDHHC6 isoform X2 [Nematostella vectensis]
MPRGICHWGPLLALSIIITLFLGGLYCIILIYTPWHSLGAMVHLGVYLNWAFLILYNFLRGIWLGPGYVPFKWRPAKESDTECLQFCHVCQGYKAPRAHHCSKCNRCVMKMDHHCPWINNCVGHYNMKSFTLFLFFVPLGCTHCAIILFLCLYNEIAGNTHFEIHSSQRLLPFDVYHLIFVTFCIGLSIGVTVAVGLLLYYQVKGIRINETAIESWIVEKANRPRPKGEVFVYPYNFGWKENFRQVLCWSHDYLGDGITWPVLPGCDQYTLTVEQLWQKELKRNRTVAHDVVKSYNGAILAWREGLWTCCSTPWTDESRMKIIPGDVVMVTRWRKHWLYGEKVTNHLNGNHSETGVISEKGWFPSSCTERHSQYHSNGTAAKKAD